MRINTSKTEIQHISRAWLAISLAFAILMSGGLSLSLGFLTSFLIAAFTVGLGFLFHELAHKFVAQRYGCFAEFRAFDNMLILAVLMSFFGFILAAPGAVFISGHVSREANGRISVAGIWTNMALALLFLLAAVAVGPNTVSYFGAYINSLLAVFNLIPFGNFDGVKVLAWNKMVYLLTGAAAVALFVISPMIAG